VFRRDFFLDLLGDDPDNPDLLDGERKIFLYSFRELNYFIRYFIVSIYGYAGSFALTG
jgi:hypothetical protein